MNMERKMKLYKMEDIMDALDSTEEIRGYAYTALQDKLNELEPAAVIRECDGCMGASYNYKDCEECRPGEVICKKDKMK